MRIWISRFALEGVKDPGNYLFVIAKNRTLDYLRKEKMDFSMRKEFSAQAPNFDESSEDRLIFNENRRIVEEAIDALPQQQKAIYLLSRHEGLTREQIASQMNISVHTVKNHLTDAIKNIKKYLLSKDIMVLVFFTAGILK